MPDEAKKPEAQKVCEWCAAIDQGTLWIPFRVGKFCPRHAQIWLVAAEAALAWVTQASTRSKMEHILKECRKEALLVRGVTVGVGPNGQNLVVRVTNEPEQKDSAEAKE